MMGTLCSRMRPIVSDPFVVSVVVVALTFLYYLFHYTRQSRRAVDEGSRENQGVSADTSSPNEPASPMVQIPRDCIECDAGCGKSKPSKRCARCHTVYYCSRECQRKHWSQHKWRCLDINDMRRNTSSMGATLPASEALNTECPICLAAEIDDPVVLRCRHGFCFSCAKEYQRYDTNNTKCPLCRTPSQGGSFTLAHVILLATRAGRSDLSVEERNQLRKRTLDELQRLDDGTFNYPVMFVKANILVGMDSHNDAIELIRDIMQRSEVGERNAATKKEISGRVQNALDNDRAEEAAEHLAELETFHANNSTCCLPTKYRVQTKFVLAQAYQGLHKWLQAIEVYMDLQLNEPTVQSDVNDMRQMIMGMTRCLYEIGNYDSAIRSGEMAIDMNRLYPEVHRYVALAHHKKGNLQMARTLLNRAAIYETPWDEENRKRAYDEWRRFEELDR